MYHRVWKSMFLGQDAKKSPNGYMEVHLEKVGGFRNIAARLQAAPCAVRRKMEHGACFFCDIRLSSSSRCVECAAIATAPSASATTSSAFSA